MRGFFIILHHALSAWLVLGGSPIEFRTPVAWLEGKPWVIEQGVDARLELRGIQNKQTGQVWDFTGWTIVGTVADESAATVYNCIVQSSPSLGIIKFILPEASVNALNPCTKYFFDGLAISPSPGLADDYHIAYLPIRIERRASRRPAP